MSHAMAPLSETGRLRLATCVVDQGWPLRRAAERFGVSVTTARRWATRYRQHGKAGMADRSSAPKHSPRRTPTRIERRVIGLRVTRRWGPARIAFHLRHQRLAVSTVHKILVRYGCPLLKWVDPATGARLRGGPKPRSYQRDLPGELVHVDIKKLGRIPDGGGHKVLGRQAGKRNRRAGVGYWYIHNAVDDRTRLAYSELLDDERKETAAGFWSRANAYFTQAGITVQRVLTDNGACYRSRDFTQALGEAISHKRTRPYRPQTNGKVERFNRTMLEEWAYAQPYTSETERAAAFTSWIHTYNHHRGHTALGGKSPADLVPNLCGQNS